MRKAKPGEILLTEQHRYGGRKKTALEQRVEELERIVRELIQWKEDRKIIQIDKNGEEIGYAIHNYHMGKTKKEDKSDF